MQLSLPIHRSPHRARLTRALALGGAVVLIASLQAQQTAPRATPAGRTPPSRRVPTFAVDPYWPKPLPNHWILGAVAGVAVAVAMDIAAASRLSLLGAAAVLTFMSVRFSHGIRETRT